MSSVSGGWEKQFTETIAGEKCTTQINLSGWLLFDTYFSLSSGGLNLQIDQKGARDERAWVNGAAFSADCKFVSEAIELET